MIRTIQERARLGSVTMTSPPLELVEPGTRGVIVSFTIAPNPFQLATLDLYRDIHKGIRAELFAVTLAAGRVDPSDEVGRRAVAGHVASVGEVLEGHAEHEDAAIEPALFVHAPELADRITADHFALEGTFARIQELAAEAADATTDQRRLTHLLYLDLASFTSTYLTHQDLEERVVMPTLERSLGREPVIAIHQAIVGSIPPDQMARSLAFMLPAMNLDDRTELLGGLRMGAPAEVFSGVMSLARSVLDPIDYGFLAERLDVA
jgi:hypothetical protein